MHIFFDCMHLWEIISTLYMPIAGKPINIYRVYVSFTQSR